MLAVTGALVNILNMQTFNVINRSTTDYQKSKKKLKNKTKNKKKYVCTEMITSLQKYLMKLDTQIDTETKFLGKIFFVIETKNVNLLSSVTSLALGLIKIYKGLFII